MCGRLKAMLLALVVIFKRALCCFSRKRRDSFSECEMLSSVNVVSENTSARRRSEAERDWNSWDETPRTIDEHIELYRQKLSAQNTPLNTEAAEPDFFQDMAPKIVKQTKVLLQKDNNIPTNFSRLQATTANLQAIGAELEDWTDDEQPIAAWEELDDEHTKNLIREKRKELRAQRQQRQKVSGSAVKNQPILLAERIDIKNNL
ncbi:Receptor-binding cancer antigen expressed on SiSo cells [Pseudolycoriella hygida]|uniref:Receptor-binding cancer antigen expressed on SiSo cells n=1 Tax=Pseudolycoriella hygida TaxID=35572 RepID=A0A9Q0MRW9_9DIPT|nr:Receptor-binding cancer antigen expressed on SiSo cells [Pseudolycoriella hygida]